MKIVKTISDLEESMQIALQHTLETFANHPEGDDLRLLVPDGYHLTVTLRGVNGRKKKWNANAEAWSPESGEIIVRCVPDSGEESLNVSAISPVVPRVKELSTPYSKPAASRPAEIPFSPQRQASSQSDVTPEQVQELCDVLAEAERAGWSFIALKRFRDDVLARKNFSWAECAEGRQAVLVKAIEQGAVITKKIPNPRAPQFPTTTIALSRSHSGRQSSEFQRYAPVPVKGEPLSATLLRDRGIR